MTQATLDFTIGEIVREGARAEQSANLGRVRGRIAPLILEYYALHRGEQFRMGALTAYVSQQTVCAPASADRVLRALKTEGRLDYIVENRAGSLYRFR